MIEITLKYVKRAELERPMVQNVDDKVKDYIEENMVDDRKAILTQISQKGLDIANRR